MSSWKKTFRAAFAAQFCAIMGFSLAMPFMPLFIRELGVTDKGEVARWAGYANAATPLTMAIFAPIWGMLADRYGRRLMVMRAMFGGAVVLVLMALVQDVYQLVACRLLQGALTGTVAALVALVAAETPRERAGYALGMMQAAVFVGFAFGPLLGGLIANGLRAQPGFATGALRYRVTFALSAILLVAAGLLVRFATREAYQPGPPAAKAGHASFRHVLAATGFLAAVFALLTLRFANSVSASTFALFIEDICGRRMDIDSVVGIVLGVGGVAAAIGCAVLGPLSDAWGHRRLLITACFASGLVSLGYFFSATLRDLIVFRVLFGLAAGGMLPAANAIIRHTTSDENMGKAYGITTSMGSVGWVAGALGGGHLAAIYSPRATFIPMAVAFWLAAALVTFSVRTDRARDAAGAAPESLG
jgi:DHA1 family multidrug resistance protein-like MFS transporter